MELNSNGLHIPECEHILGIYIYIYVCLRCFSRFMCVRMGWRSAKHLALTHYICNFQQCIFKLHNTLQYNIPRPLQYSKLCSTYIEQFMGVFERRKNDENRFCNHISLWPRCWDKRIILSLTWCLRTAKRVSHHISVIYFFLSNKHSSNWKKIK